jgi:hypothetical protein
MTRIEFDAFRLRCKAAFDAYHIHAANVIEHSKGGAALTRSSTLKNKRSGN